MRGWPTIAVSDDILQYAGLIGIVQFGHALRWRGFAVLHITRGYIPLPRRGGRRVHWAKRRGARGWWARFLRRTIRPAALIVSALIMNEMAMRISQARILILADPKTVTLIFLNTVIAAAAGMAIWLLYDELVAAWVLFVAHSIALLLLVGNGIIQRTVSRRVLKYRFAVCTRCFYPLKGCGPRGKCPECGTPFDVREVRAFWRQWLLRWLEIIRIMRMRRRVR